MKKVPNFKLRVKKYYRNETTFAITSYNEVSERLLMRKELNRINEFIRFGLIDIAGTIYEVLVD